MIGSFKDLDVYKKSFDISIEIHNRTKSFPSEEKFGMTDQIRRASKSVCANIAEGFARQKSSSADFKRFLIMALGSANEVLVWIDYSVRLNCLSPSEAEKWSNEYQIIVKMISSFHSKIK